MSDLSKYMFLINKSEPDHPCYIVISKELWDNERIIDDYSGADEEMEPLGFLNVSESMYEYDSNRVSLKGILGLKALKGMSLSDIDDYMEHIDPAKLLQDCGMTQLPDNWYELVQSEIFDNMLKTVDYLDVDSLSELKKKFEQAIEDDKDE